MKMIRKIINKAKYEKNKIKSLFKINSILNEQSYYPEMKRKNRIKRLFENVNWILKYGEPNMFYNLYGFDIIDMVNQNEYLNYLEFRIDRDQRNKLNELYNYVVLLRDKYMFSEFFNSQNISVVKNKAIIIDGIIYNSDFNIINNPEKLFENTVFIKNIDGECADGVYCIKNYGEFVKIKKKFENGKFIIQDKLIQHELLSKLNPKSVNTIRIVTYRRNNKVEILASGIRIGTKKSNNVDNWAAGGLYVEVKEDGKLTKNGFAKPIYGGKKSIHPDTNIVFENYQLPFYDEVKKLVIAAHNRLYGIDSIGWDVAITVDGPVLIEGNDNWEISLMQANHGLKDKWYKGEK